MSHAASTEVLDKHICIKCSYLCKWVYLVFSTIYWVKWNIYSLFWIHTTFQYLIFGKGKWFELYLSLIGFQFLDFLSFLQVSYILPELIELSNLVATLVLVQTEDSPANFSNACWPFWCEDSVDQPFDFSSSTTSPNHATRLTLTSLVSTD